MTALLSEPILAVKESVLGIVTRFGLAIPTTGGGGVLPLAGAAGGGSAVAGRPIGAGDVPRPITTPRTRATTTTALQIEDRPIRSALSSRPGPRAGRPARRDAGAPSPAAPVAVGTGPTAGLSRAPTATDPRSPAARSPRLCGGPRDRPPSQRRSGIGPAPHRRRADA